MRVQPDFFASFPPDIRSLWRMNGGGFDFAETAYRAWLGTAGRIQGDAMEFARNRMEKDAAAFAEFGKCKTAVEAFNVQVAYARDAFADFFGEGQRIAAMMGDAARQSMAKASGEEAPPAARRASHKSATASQGAGVH